MCVIGRGVGPDVEGNFFLGGGLWCVEVSSFQSSGVCDCGVWAVVCVEVVSGAVVCGGVMFGIVVSAGVVCRVP